MVFSWVDGSSSEFQRQRAAQMQEYVVGEGDDGGTLPPRRRTALRAAQRAHVRPVGSAHLHRDRLPAPRRGSRITRRSRRAQRGVLRRPDRASDAQLACRGGQLHRIDGLAEHFLYSNDDMFFGRPVSRSSSSPRRAQHVRRGARAHRHRRPDTPPQRARQRPASEQGPAAKAVRSHHHAGPAALRDAHSPQRHARSSSASSPMTTPAPRRRASAPPPTSR